MMTDSLSLYVVVIVYMYVVVIVYMYVVYMAAII